MLFNSLVFFVFIAVFFLCYRFLDHASLSLRWLVICLFSLLFYGWWDVRYVPLLIINGIIDFYAALAIKRWARYKRIFLILSLSMNLGILFFFKYLSFFIESMNWMLGLFEWKPLSFTPSYFFLVLPIGLSFYTFQSMSYTIDVYKERLAPTHNVLHFFSSLTCFPHLVAGPIVRAADFLPQLLRVRKPTDLEKWNAVRLISIGFFKKVVLADNIAPMVNNAFGNENHVTSGIYWWIIMFGFAFQIYFDFSGYSDIARGLAKLMGFHFRLNFNHPYLATSFRNFWKRWHISLSTWFRDYVFKPIGGSRKGKFRAHLNLWITMIVSGIWHGAGLTFIIWGALHALYQSIENLMRASKTAFALSVPVRMILVLIATTLAWVFFRAESLHQSCIIIRKMVTFRSGSFPLHNIFYVGLIALILGVLIELIYFLKIKWIHFASPRVSWYVEILQVAIIINMCIFLRGTGQQFIYFQF